MRYFLALFLITCVLIVVIAGPRGEVSRRPPLQIWDDMDDQIKLRPQASADFAGWGDGRSSRLRAEGTVPRRRAIRVGDQEIHRYEDHPVITGREPGTTNFVDLIPVAVTEGLLARGRERYQIHCVPCHGALGDGNGVVRKYGHGAIAPLTDEARVRLPDGYLYHVIRSGSPAGLMLPYGAQVDVEDRWAIVAYVRALQLARLGRPEDLPEPLRAQLK
jgi:mono/diheme cytochrome c family protein